MSTEHTNLDDNKSEQAVVDVLKESGRSDSLAFKVELEQMIADARSARNLGLIWLCIAPLGLMLLWLPGILMLILGSLCLHHYVKRVAVVRKAAARLGYQGRIEGDWLPSFKLPAVAMKESNSR